MLVYVAIYVGDDPAHTTRVLATSHPKVVQATVRAILKLVLPKR